MGQKRTTHVANAYSEDIFIKVDGDRQYVTLRDINVEGSGSVKGVEVSAKVGVKTEYRWEYANKNGYTRIQKSTFPGFNPDSDRNVVYITILTEHRRVVAHCYPLTEDFSAI